VAQIVGAWARSGVAHRLPGIRIKEKGAGRSFPRFLGILPIELSDRYPIRRDWLYEPLRVVPLSERFSLIMAKTKIAERIRRIRVLRGLTQAELAERAHMSRQALAAVESGVYLPNVAIAVKLARAIGATVEEIFGDADDGSEHRVDACWKRSPAITTDRARVVLARIGGKVVAVAEPTAHLTLPVSSGVRVKTSRGRADISTRLLDSEIDSTLVLAGCDPAVSMLIGWMARAGSQINAVALPCSSGKALAALADQSVHAAGVHLRDPKSGDYNFIPVRRAVERRRICLINFARWEVGLAMAAGNPLGIRDFSDLPRSDVRIVNRERGSGARQVLDEALVSSGLNSKRIAGYGNEVSGHLGVAAAIHDNDADTGVTIRVAAEAYGLDFIPIREERYDLAIPESEMESVPVRRMLDALNSGRFAREVAQLCAYDTERMGDELARIDC
jgi:putative molybdopterin biosynthesis protein